MKNNTIEDIYSNISYLNPKLKKIGEYILENLEECTSITIKDLSDKTGVAQSSITRFVKEIGFDNFQKLKVAIASHLASNIKESEIEVYESISVNDTPSLIIEKLIYQNSDIMNKLSKTLNIEQLKKAVKLIQNAQNIFFLAIGSSSLSAKEGLMRFLRVGKKCFFSEDTALQLINAGIATKNDLFIAITDQAITRDINEAIKIAKSNNAKTILITSNQKSPLNKIVDVNLFTPSKNININSKTTWEFTPAKTAQLLTIDILYSIYSIKEYSSSIENINKTKEAMKSTRL